jgi:hypothetical protein
VVYNFLKQGNLLSDVDQHAFWFSSGTSVPQQGASEKEKTERITTLHLKKGDKEKI